MPTSRLKKLGFALVATGLLLGLAEIGLRIATRELGKATISNALVQRHVEQGAMAFDPDLGWVRSDVPNPGLGINADGFRYGEVQREKPEGTWRGFTFGDSQTYGAGSESDQTYTAVAERSLRSSLGMGEELQLINTGISGYTSLQVLRLIETRILDWDPDLLVVDCRTHDSAKDGELPRIGGPEAKMQGLLWHSRLYYVLRFWIERLRPQHARPMHASSLDANSAEFKARFGNHDAIAELAEERGVDVLFVDYPIWEGEGVTCLAPPEELPPGVPVARACAALQASGRHPGELFLDNNHLSVEGNRIVGEALALAIRENAQVR